MFVFVINYNLPINLNYIKLCYVVTMFSYFFSVLLIECSILAHPVVITYLLSYNLELDVAISPKSYCASNVSTAVAQKQAMVLMFVVCTDGDQLGSTYCITYLKYNAKHRKDIVCFNTTIHARTPRGRLSSD